MEQEISPIPSHVPPHLVRDFDLFNGCEVAVDPYIGLSHLFSGPDIFYTPRNGGHWVVIRAKDARSIFADAERFSSDHTKYGSGKPFGSASSTVNEELDHPLRMIPAQTDDPDHAKYRKVLNSPLSPASIQKLREKITNLSLDLIEGVRLRGNCEFVNDVALMFPVTIFLELADLPFEDRFELQRMAELITRTPGTWAEGMAQISDYLRPTMLRRRERPGDDILSIMATAKIDDEFIGETELLQMAINVVMGGLDTVVSGLSFIIRYLARNPEIYQNFRKNPQKIKHNLEELLRIHGVASTERYAKSDIDYDGVQIKSGDRITLIPALYGVDPQAVERPLDIDFSRPASPHMLFGAGIHHCVGSHLARFEMKIFLEEWMRAIPEFALKPGSEVESFGGFVLQPKQVHLEWHPSMTVGRVNEVN